MPFEGVGVRNTVGVALGEGVPDFVDVTVGVRVFVRVAVAVGVLGLAYLLGGITGRKGVTMGTASAIAIASYVLYTLSQTTGALDTLITKHGVQLRQFSDEIVNAVLSHGETGVSRDTPMAKALYAIDELTGLLGRRALGERLDRRNGQDTFVALYNHQIPPGAAAVVHYRIAIPADVVGPVTIDAALRYRKFDTTYLRYVQGEAFRRNDLPIVTLASDRVAVATGPGEATGVQAADTGPSLWERWNDYGIGLLREGSGGAGKGELRQAEHAFRQAEDLGDARGALNLVRVYFREGRLEEASAALQRAGNAEPPAPPWSIAWYSALIDRENGHLEAAIDTLESIAGTRFNEARARGFDFSRDILVLNELGRAEFERSRQLRGEANAAQRQAALERARDWFLQTLEIEPEDLAAHHNLALVYSALGETQLAEVQRELHEKYRPDDHAIEQAVARHRRSNPAADHAAAAIAIYDLNRETAAGAVSSDAVQLSATVHKQQQRP